MKHVLSSSNKLLKAVFSQQQIRCVGGLPPSGYWRVPPKDRVKTTLDTGHTLRVRGGHLTLEDTETIVSPANAFLMPLRELPRWIAMFGGRPVTKEGVSWLINKGEVQAGEIAYTTAGRLPYKCIIHAVAPYWKNGTKGEKDKLKSAIYKALDYCTEKQIESVAIPPLGLGIHEFPFAKSAAIMVDAIRKWALEHKDKLPKDIRITVEEDEILPYFEKEFLKVFPDGRDFI